MALNSLITFQPGKAIFSILAVAFNAARLPLWLVRFLVPSLRQNPRWTFGQALRVRIVRAVLYNLSLIQVHVPTPLAPGHEKGRFVTFPPARKELYTGCAAADPEVEPVDVGGTWYPRVPGAGDEAGHVVLFFHGGAYVIGDGRDADAGFAARTLVRETDATHLFALQYRLASHPKCRFPAQLQDAVSAYSYLMNTLGIHPNRIVIAGDSAGGNLCLSFLRYISDHGEALSLPAPTAAFLFSPWPSPNLTLKHPASMDHHPNSQADIVVPEFGCWGARCWTPSPATGLTLASPNLDFVGNAAFPTETPVWIMVGESERLLVDQLKMADGLRGVKGNVVELHVERDSPHDICLVGHKLGFAEQAKACARRAGEFLKEKRRS